MSRGVGIALSSLDDAHHAHRKVLNMDDSDEMPERIARLSAGQLDCLRLVDQLLSSKEIAAELKISPHTVNDNLRVIFEKVGARSRSELSARIFLEQYRPRVMRGERPGPTGCFA